MAGHEGHTQHAVALLVAPLGRVFGRLPKLAQDLTILGAAAAVMFGAGATLSEALSDRQAFQELSRQYATLADSVRDQRLFQRLAAVEERAQEALDELATAAPLHTYFLCRTVAADVNAAPGGCDIVLEGTVWATRIDNLLRRREP